MKRDIRNDSVIIFYERVNSHGFNFNPKKLAFHTSLGTLVPN